MLFAIVALVLAHHHGFGTWAAFAYTIVFPPGFYIFAIIAICGFEANQIPTDALRGDPDANFVLLPLILAALVSCSSCCDCNLTFSVI
jgi:ATP-binding cassette, subfamily A (ABC1), member 3